MLGFMAGELSHLLDFEPRGFEPNMRRTGHPEDANTRGFEARYLPDGWAGFVVTRSLPRGGDAMVRHTHPRRAHLRIQSDLTRSLGRRHVDIKPITTDTFVADVLNSDKPVLVDFWAPWCGPCKAIAPMLAAIAEEHAEKITVVKVDIDENPQIAADYRVMSIPTMTLFVHGQPTVSIPGAKSKSAIVDRLAAYL
jgi:thioredoxin 1